jgi:N-acetylmuramoyl-L-alanine amidase
MAVIKTNAEDTKMLTRIMRAEAEGEGELGMLMVGKVDIRRIASTFQNKATAQLSINFISNV